MKKKREKTPVVMPSIRWKRVFRCKKCGKVFTKARLLPLLPVQCPYCGSFKIL
jgi:phage FluMu protein Com